MRIDPMFIHCVKEEIAAGERVVILAATPQIEARYRDFFTDEELEFVAFMRDPSPASGKVESDAT